VADSAADAAQNDGVAVADRDDSSAAIADATAATGVTLGAGVATNGTANGAIAAPSGAAAAPSGAASPVLLSNGASEPDAAERAATAQGGLAGRWLRRFLSARLRRRLAALAAWSHTPRALRLGTAAAAALALVTAGALALVGFAGVGTHVYLPPAPPPDSYPYGISYDSGLFPPVFYPPPMLFGPPLDTSTVPVNALANLVLQTYDVPLDFHATVQSAVPGAPADGLIGSYHVVFQRALGSVDTGDLGSVISILSLVGAYRDVPAAAAQIENDDLSTLGRLAGLPDFVAEPVSVTAVIGDETRVVHLSGDADGVPAGVYLVEFRYGAVDGIVAVASPAGSESLSDAMQLARRQEARLEQSAPLNP
jgi:hypothetical protein